MRGGIPERSSMFSYGIEGMNEIEDKTGGDNVSQKFGIWSSWISIWHQETPSMFTHTLACSLLPLLQSPRVTGIEQVS